MNKIKLKMSDKIDDKQCLLDSNDKEIHNRTSKDGEILSDRLDPENNGGSSAETTIKLEETCKLTAKKEQDCPTDTLQDTNNGGVTKSQVQRTTPTNSDASKDTLGCRNINENPQKTGYRNQSYDNDYVNGNINNDATGNNEDSSNESSIHRTDNDTAVVADSIQTNDIESSIQSCISHTTIKVYTRRWYILILFTLVGFTQGALIDVYQVTAQSAEAAFGWSDATTSLMQNWIYLTYVIGVGPFSWLIDTKGMRISVIICATLTFIGTLFRCLSTSPPLVTWFANLGNIFVGLGGPVAFTAGPVVSSIWFPPDQRTTATAIGTISGFLGPCATFVIGPYFVDVPILNNHTEVRCHESNCSNGTVYSNIDQIKHQMLYLRYGECSVCLVVLILCLIYFPSKPPHPPSLSAALEKVSFFSGIKHLFRKENRNFWLVCLVYMLTTGLYDVWSSLFDVNLKTFHVAEDEAGLVGALSMLTGSVAAIFIGRATDLLSGYMKVTSVVLVAACCLASYWFLLVCQFLRPFSSVQLYASAILQGLCINGPIPLFYEMAVESNYPINETVTSGMMSLLYNIFPLIFLAIFWIPNIGTDWMNWFMYACVLLAFPLILLFQERFNRLKVDKGNLDKIVSDRD